MRILPCVLAALGCAAAAAAVVSCSSVSNSRIGIDAPPFSTGSFGPLGDYLDHRCGTLDCHGQPGRNFRVWGCEGMRLDAGQTPNCKPSVPGGGRTTVDEYEATYRSLVALEPQVMSEVYCGLNGSACNDGCKGQVAADGGALYPPTSSCHPELLTFVRKSRGIEAHKGGQLICTQPPCPPGVPPPNPFDPQDVCIVSWLEGATDQSACVLARGVPQYPMDASVE